MRNVPHDLGGCVDRTLCPYQGYFPKIECILCKCNTCGTAKFREILNDNKDKTKDERQRFLVKFSYTKREKKKDGTTQSFLHWKSE